MTPGWLWWNGGSRWQFRSDHRRSSAFIRGKILFACWGSMERQSGPASGVPSALGVRGVGLLG
jgi:hypothetical protein